MRWYNWMNAKWTLLFAMLQISALYLMYLILFFLVCRNDITTQHASYRENLNKQLLKFNNSGWRLFIRITVSPRILPVCFSQLKFFSISNYTCGHNVTLLFLWWNWQELRWWWVFSRSFWYERKLKHSWASISSIYSQV